MKTYTWKGTVQYNGDGESIYEEVEFRVTKRQYEQIQRAIAAGKPVYSLSCYQDLKKRLIKAFDLYEYKNGDKPVRADFDNREEYEEAMEEYEEEKDLLEESFVLVDATVYDPGTETRFKKGFIGKRYPRLGDSSGELTFDFHEEDDERIVDYTLTVKYENGVITDLCNITATGLAGDDATGSSCSDCEPNYDFLEWNLEDELELDSEDDDE